MAQFSSGKHRSRVTQSRWGNYRPSYLPLRNLPNRILRDFREAIERGDMYADAQSWITNLSDMNAESDAWRYGPAEIEHAERALTRLANLNTKEK